MKQSGNVIQIPNMADNMHSFILSSNQWMKVFLIGITQSLCTVLKISENNCIME